MSERFFSKIDDAIAALEEGTIKPRPEEVLDCVLEALEDIREAMRYLDKGSGKLPAITRDSDIDDLGLSVRSYNCLKRYGVQTVGELANMPNEEFGKVRNLGRRSLEEIKEKLKEIGLDKEED